jgi:pyridoxal phosphate-dependent aminotransferase EpsN
MVKPPRVYLSMPHLGGGEFEFVREAFASNWVAPLGPHVDAFETEFAAVVGSPHAAALSSGTAALHLALRLCGVQPGDEVFCSTLTFSASANPIVYEGGRPVFIDSERESWNMDPACLEAALADRARAGRLPRAVIVVHLYGQSAQLEPIAAVCDRYGVTLIEDAAEALGATYQACPDARPIVPGTRGRLGIYSFNGNKIITTSGGGMLVSADEALIRKARFLATQARDPAPHFQHSEIGFNYRLSNVLAGIGRGQLRVLADRVAARRAHAAAYAAALADLPGITFMPEAPWGRCSRWLSCILVDPAAFGADREKIRLALEAENIESRPVWKPMHLQPVFAGCARFGGEVAEALFQTGLCLPSGSAMSVADRERVVALIRRTGGRGKC